MNILKTFSIVLLMIFTISCQGQTNTIKVVEIKNEDVKLILTEIKGEKTKKFSDEKKYFFVTTHAVLTNSHLDIEKELYEEVYYFAIGSFDESAYKEALVFKTEELINPMTESVEESKDGKKFAITISYIDRKDLYKRIKTVIELPKYVNIKK